MNELIDDAFYVKEQRWGTWVSYDVNDNSILTSLTEEHCIRMTRAYLQMMQEEKNGKKFDGATYSGEVFGKL